jgi:hypothetical protein
MPPHDTIASVWGRVIDTLDEGTTSLIDEDLEQPVGIRKSIT